MTNTIVKSRTCKHRLRKKHYGMLLAMILVFKSVVAYPQKLDLDVAQQQADIEDSLSTQSYEAQALTEPQEVSNDLPLSEQVQTLKEQILELNRDLFILEEELLFPASTQVAVFLSMDKGEFFSLDAVELKIDNKIVTHYLYTERQVDALRRGGVQRLFVGNLRSGKHEISAFFTGRGPEGRDFRRAASLSFEKQTDAKMLELKISDNIQSYQAEFSIVVWQ